MSRVRSPGLIALVALTLSLCEAGFNPETGSYIFQQYSAAEYGASPQYWSIAQDPRGIMYFANTNGLLEFDGVSWRILHPAGNSMVYSVAADAQGTVYAGTVGDFGFLKPDAAGVLKFSSLKERLPARDRGFLHVWRILPAAEGVYFSSYQRLFRLNSDGTLKTWRPDKKFARAFHVLGALYVQSTGEGLLRLRQDRFEPVPGGEAFKGEAVNDGVRFGGGALIATNTSLYRLTAGGAEPFHTAADAYLAKSLIYSMRALPGGEIAIGTRKGGLVLMSGEGGVDRVVTTKSDPIGGDFISDIYNDPQGGVWLAGLGITRFNPGLSSYSAQDGLEGPVECMTRHAGAMFVGTDTGVFRMSAAGPEKPRFSRVAGIGDRTWALLSYGEGLLAATDHGVFLISGNEARNILPVTKPIFDIALSSGDPNVLYAAGRTAVFQLRRKGAKWTTENSLSMPNEEFRSVLEDAGGRVWATTSKGKIWRGDLAREPAQSEEFGAAQGVPEGWSNARRLDGKIVFATTKGLKRYSDRSKRFEPDMSLGEEFADGRRDVFNIFETHNGNVWITGEKYHGLLIRQSGANRWRSMPLSSAGIREIYWMSTDDDGTVWASGEKFALHRWESSLAGDPDRDFHVISRRILISSNNDLELYGGAGPFDSSHLPWKDNALRFEFASPFYENPAAIEYQVRLEGSDRNWSPWSTETRKDYTHLPEGRYHLRVRARSPHGSVAEDASLSFGIAPPWYRTWWVYATYAVFAAFAIWGIIHARTRQLEEDKRRLEGIVEERTIEIRAEERKSHNLLLNILPAAVANELKSTGAVKPVAFDDVTVCFTDFVGFTLSSEKLQPGILVDALNEYFTRFDEVVARYGLEKLKTIGDSYMFASGLPTPRASHAVDAALAALEMVRIVQELGSRDGGTGWGIRVGLHSGPVVAGVVGIRKFAFDIWGNTVNFASRMESSGVPGRVNMSERTCRLTRGLMECETRGNVKIKEGRELPMFLVVGPAADFAARYRREFGEEPLSVPIAPGSESHAFTAS